jgi:hypothetical protein
MYLNQLYLNYLLPKKIFLEGPFLLMPIQYSLSILKHFPKYFSKNQEIDLNVNLVKILLSKLLVTIQKDYRLLLEHFPLQVY